MGEQSGAPDLPTQHRGQTLVPQRATLAISRRREDTDLQVGVVPRPVRVRLRAEGSGGQRQEHGARTPHGQQGAAERRSPESTRQEEKRVPHHRKKAKKKKPHPNNNSLI